MVDLLEGLFCGSLILNFIGLVLITQRFSTDLNVSVNMWFAHIGN
jgi:hypothetical protein